MNTKKWFNRGEKDDARSYLSSSGNSPPIAECIKAKIFAVLASSSEPIPAKKLLSLVEGRRKIKLLALRILLEEGVIRRNGTGRKGDPYLYFPKRTDLLETKQPGIVEEMLI